MLFNTKIRMLFYLFWFISLLLQAYFTELISDEAYYWMYSRELAWGYFDHPPGIALLIKIGYSLFSNELGVRLLSVIMSTLTIFFLEKIVAPTDLKTFYFLVVSVAILHFIGFYAIPDAPLLFTSVIYLFIFQKFIENATYKNSILLGLMMALMSLSKYHAILIIGLTIIANFNLLRSRYFWIAIFTAITLVIPHILWQIDNNFPSLNYHFFDRSANPYKISHTINYLLEQLFVLGPVTGIIFFIAAYKIKATNQFEKTLKVLFWGGYIFFFLMSFKGSVEGHWTLFIVLPALFFGYHFLVQLKNRKKILLFTVSFSLFLIGFFRIYIAVDAKPDNSTALARLTKQFRHQENMLKIKAVANNHPVAFMNSFQKASLYSFYAKSDGFSFNNVRWRKNQFDIWDTENRNRGKKVLVVPEENKDFYDSILTLPKKTPYRFVDNFQSYSKIKIHALNLPKKVATYEVLKVQISIEKPKDYDIDLNANPLYPSYIYYEFFNGKRLFDECNSFQITNDMLGKTHELTIESPAKPGVYGLFISIRTGWLTPTKNSRKYQIVVEEANN